MPQLVFVPTVAVQGPDQLILGFATDTTRPQRLLAVGGQRVDVTLLSEDAGRTWDALPSPGKGLRGAFIEGDLILVCGEYGFVGRSDDGGATWTTLESGAGGCLFGLTRDPQGTFWLAGDGGFVATSTDGLTFKRLSGSRPSLSRMARTPLGVLIPSDAPGHLFVGNTSPKPKLAQWEIGAGVDLMTACVTPRGTVIVVGNGGVIYRSADASKANSLHPTFEKIASPTTNLLAGVCATASGRIVACGAGGTLLVSDDDGLTFPPAIAPLTTGVLWCCVALGDAVFVGGPGGLIARLTPLDEALAASPGHQTSAPTARRDIVPGVLVDAGLRAMVRPWRGCPLGVLADAPPPLPGADAAWTTLRGLYWACDRYRVALAKKPSRTWSLISGMTARGRRLGARQLNPSSTPCTLDDATALVAAAFDDGYQGPFTQRLHDALADYLVATLGVVDAVRAALAGLPRELPYTSAGVFSRLRDRVVTADEATYDTLCRAASEMGLTEQNRVKDTRRRIHVKCALAFLLPLGAEPRPEERQCLADAARHVGKFGDLDVAHATLLASADTATFQAFMRANPEPRHEFFSGGERPYLATLLARGDRALLAALPTLKARYDMAVDTWVSLLARVDDPAVLEVFQTERLGKGLRWGGVGIATVAALDPPRAALFIESLRARMTDATDATAAAALDVLRVPTPAPEPPRLEVTLRALSGPSEYVPPARLAEVGLLPVPDDLALPPELSFREEEVASAESRTPYDGHWHWQPDDGPNPEALVRSASAAEADAYVSHRERYGLPSSSALYVLLPQRLHARLLALGAEPDEGQWNFWQPALLKGGLALLPPVRAFANNEGADVDDRLATLMPVGDVQCVPPVVRAFAGKKNKAQARSWILRHPAHAIAGALAMWAHDPAAADAPRVLRFLDTLGRREDILRLAGAARAAQVTALLDEDPLSGPKVKLPVLPPYAQAEALSSQMPALGLGAADLQALLQRMAASNPDELHPAIAAAKRRVPRAALAELARTLFEAWLAAGADPKQTFCLHAVGFFGDDEAVRRLAALARNWPGESAAARAVQALDTLVLNGGDAALLQLALIAEKSKFAAFKKAAAERIGTIAEVRGLTPDELADRLVPTFGLDDAATTTLDFGPRQFTVTFDEQLVPRVKDPTGARLKELPKPAKTDDAALAKDAKGRIAGLKKDVKTIADLLLRRLERAMTEGRRWTPEVFDVCFVQHPLAIHVARCLLWEAVDAQGARLGLFRIAEDRTLADASDAAFVLPPGTATVGVPHPVTLDAADVTRFGGLFADYNLLQPFAQLGRPVHRLRPDEHGQTAWTRHRGKTQPAPALVFGLEGRGWRRYDVVDGGAFNTHVKDLGGVRAIGSYEGNVGMGYIEASETLTFNDVTFSSVRGHEALTLDRLPPAVVSEIALDLEGVLGG